MRARGCAPARTWSGHVSIADVNHPVMGRATHQTVATSDPWPHHRFTTVVLSTTVAPGTDERVTAVASLEEVVALPHPARLVHPGTSTTATGTTTTRYRVSAPGA